MRRARHSLAPALALRNYLAAAMTRGLCAHRDAAAAAERGARCRRTARSQDEKERSDKNGNMAFKVHKMAVIRALLLRGQNASMAKMHKAKNIG